MKTAQANYYKEQIEPRAIEGMLLTHCYASSAWRGILWKKEKSHAQEAMPKGYMEKLLEKNCPDFPVIYLSALLGICYRDGVKKKENSLLPIKRVVHEEDCSNLSMNLIHALGKEEKNGDL